MQDLWFAESCIAENKTYGELMVNCMKACAPQSSFSQFRAMCIAYECRIRDEKQLLKGHLWLVLQSCFAYVTCIFREQ